MYRLGRNARYSEKLKVGDHIKIWEDTKQGISEKISEEKTVTKVAYEVSISKMEVYENENNRQRIHNPAKERWIPFFHLIICLKQIV